MSTEEYGNVQMWKVTVKSGRKTIETHDRVTGNVADSIKKNRQALGYKVTLKKVK